MTNGIIKNFITAAVGMVLLLGISLSEGQYSWGVPFSVHKTSVASSAAFVPLPQLELNEPETDINPPKDAKSVLVPVLMYHHVQNISDEDRRKDVLRSDLTVSVSDFEDQVRYFKNAGFENVKISEIWNSLTRGSKLPKKGVVFTFDDGYSDVFANAIPILLENGYTGAFAVPTGLIGQSGYATWDQVLAADRMGMEILSHTENHLDLASSAYSKEDLTREIQGSKNSLEQILGHKVEFFVYPYGRSTSQIETLVNASGYKMAFTTKFGLWISPNTLQSEPRVRVHGVDGLSKLRKVLPN